jgi:hypothetical protein
MLSDQGGDCFLREQAECMYKAGEKKKESKKERLAEAGFGI